MKNRISKIFVCFIVANILFVSSLFAAANISVSTVKAKLGEEITVDVTIKDNPGFVGYQMYISYDSSKLQYISSTNGEVVEDKMAMISNNEKSNNIKQVCVGTDIDKNGKLMSITFKVKEDIKDANIPLELKVIELVDDVNGNAKNVEYTVTNGNVIIENNKGNITSTTTKDYVNVVKGDDGKISLNLKDEDKNKKVIYRSKDETKATVDESGNVTAITPGDVEIEALVDGEVIDTVTINIPLEEDKAVQMQEENNIESKSKILTKKNVVITVIVLVILAFAIICSIIYVRKKKERKNNEKK